MTLFGIVPSLWEVPFWCCLVDFGFTLFRRVEFGVTLFRHFGKILAYLVR